jgi:hypothetical protein
MNPLLLPGFKPYAPKELDGLDWDVVWVEIQLSPGEAVERILKGIRHNDRDAYLDSFSWSFRVIRDRLVRHTPIGSRVLRLGLDAPGKDYIYDPEHPYYQCVFKRYTIIQSLLSEKISPMGNLDLALALLT